MAMETEKRHARYTDIEGTPFEVFAVPSEQRETLVVTDPATHPFGYLLDHTRQAFPREMWAGEIAPETLCKLPQLSEDDAKWAEAWGWWALDAYKRAKHEGTLPKPEPKRRHKTGAKSIQF